MKGHEAQEILVIQVTTLGLMAFRSAVRGQFEQQRDYIGLSTEHGIEKFVFKDQPQLLITGAIDPADTTTVAPFVESLRRKNPQLVVVFYTSTKIPGDHFDMMIEKMTDSASEEVINAIKNFRQGKLRRNSVR